MNKIERPMIERIEQVIWDKVMGEQTITNVRDIAKAVIEAMMEPTEGMTNATYLKARIKIPYKQMIKAALEGK